MKLFIDDERVTPAEYDQRAWTVQEAISILKNNEEKLEVVSFDYDAHSYLNWTFQEVAFWMRDNNVWPKEIRIHTANYWEGRPWLDAFFGECAHPSVIIDSTDPWDFQLDYSKAPDWVRELVRAQLK